MQFTSKSLPKPKMFRLQKSKIKTMLIIFFDKQGVIHKECVPEGQTVNSAFYIEVIGRLLKRISRVRPQFRAEGSWFLLHDNVRSHSALAMTAYLAKPCAVEINHTLYSPDFAPADIFHFSTVKTAVEGKMMKT
jgi:hypothetical protein